MDKLVQLVNELKEASSSLSVRAGEISSTIENDTNSAGSLEVEINKSLLILDEGIEELNKRIDEMKNNKVWK